MRKTTPDDRLSAVALRLGWQIPARERAKTLRAMLNIVLSRSKWTTQRARVGAFKALLAVDKMNLDAIRVGITAKEHDEMLARFETLEKQIEESNRLAQMP